MKRFRRITAPILGALLIVLSLTGSAFAADKYVALGDSYSAGNGANSTNLNAACNRNTYAYPYLVSQQRPNTQLTFHEVFSSGDSLCINFTMTGTHVADFLGVPATERDIALPGITVLHFRDGKCVERWSQADMLGLLVQLGAVPPPG